MHRWSCFLILFSFYKISKGIALPTRLPQCNCIPLKECHSISYLLLNHKPHEAEMIYKIVQNAGCGYTGLDPLVCCPITNANHKMLTRTLLADSDATITTRARPDAWVWDSEPPSTRFNKFTKIPEMASPSVTSTKSKKGKSKDFYEENDIFNFKDPITKENCPHSFYEETVEDHDDDDDDDVNKGEGHDYDIKYHDKAHEHNKSPPSHNHNFHHFHDFHSHNSHHVHDHASTSDDNSGYVDEEYPTTTFRPINKDGIFVYPDDKRLNRPLHFLTDIMPTTKKITTTTMKTKAITTSTTTTVKPIEQSKVNLALCGLPEVDVMTGERIYPWISRIAYINKTNNVTSYRCSGSVVSESHILTAAHCVINLARNLQLSHVRIGSVAVSPNCTANNNVNCNIAYRRYQIADILVHPNYDQPKYANDIALVKIIGKANGYTPICLPPNLPVSVRDQFIGTFGIALGWTANVAANDTITPRIRYLSLPIVNTTECAITYAKLSENQNDPIVITPSQLCAQGRPMNDVCQGDSGGPFMDEGSSGLINSNGRHSLLGIVAFGPTICGMSNIPGVFTRVSSYLEWIIEGISLR